jgi:preprotein translocase subunit SecE
MGLGPFVPGSQSEQRSMKKTTKDKPKTALKEAGTGGNRGQVVKLKAGKSRTPWYLKLPPVGLYWQNTKQFLAEAVQELKKVTWPNRKETMGATGVVIFLVIVLSIYLGLVDFGLSRLVRIFIH